MRLKYSPLAILGHLLPDRENSGGTFIRAHSPIFRGNTVGSSKMERWANHDTYSPLMAGCAPSFAPCLFLLAANAGYALRVMRSDTTCETLGHSTGSMLHTRNFSAEIGEASIAPRGFLMNAGAWSWPLLFSQGQIPKDSRCASWLMSMPLNPAASARNSTAGL